MGASESALTGAEPQLGSRRKGITCIAEAAETQQRVLHIPLLCGASTAVDFSTVLGEGSYGVVYGGFVDRSTCRHSASTSSRRQVTYGSLFSDEDEVGDSRQTSCCWEGCQYCFSDRTQHVAVKALRHSSQRQQRFFINRFKFLQLVRIQQLLASAQGEDGLKQSEPVDIQSATSASSKEEGDRTAAIAANPAFKAFFSGAPQKAVLAAAAAGDEAAIADVATAVHLEESRTCSCCKFLQFPSFDSLHLLQVFGVYACSRVSKEFLVMEKLSGPTLFSYLRDKYSGFLPKEWEACQIIVPILRGLSCIHQEGVSARQKRCWASEMTFSFCKGGEVCE